VLPAVLPPEAPPALKGLSLPFRLPGWFWDGGVVAWMVLGAAGRASAEFFLVAVADVFPEAFAPALFFADRVLVPPTGRLAPEPRFRFLITSVFRLSGLTTP
jgi:hypothetical protein